MILKDDLRLSTKHQHTLGEWVLGKKDTFADMMSNFTLSRFEFYKAQCFSITGFNLSVFGRTLELKEPFISSLLKSSFRRCYSILDSIAISLLNCLNINPNNIKTTEGNKIFVYYSNIWDLNLISEEKYKSNQFLHALYSISKDLDNKDYSALKDFKDIRNAIEHNLLIAGNFKKIEKHNGVIKMPFSDLIVSTKILLSLTRSAIFSYVYFIRRESKNSLQKG